MRNQKTRRNSGIVSQRKQVAFALRDIAAFEAQKEAGRPYTVSRTVLGLYAHKGQTLALSPDHVLTPALRRIDERTHPDHRLRIDVVGSKWATKAWEARNSSDEQLRHRLQDTVMNLPYNTQIHGTIGAAAVIASNPESGETSIGYRLAGNLMPGLEIEAKRILRNGFDCGFPVETPHLRIARLPNPELAQQALHSLDEVAVQGLHIVLGAPHLRPL